jgi:hypothetical protein
MEKKTGIDDSIIDARQRDNGTEETVHGPYR